MLFKLKHRKPRKHVILKYLKHNCSVLSMSYKTRYRLPKMPPCNYNFRFPVPSAASNNNNHAE